MLFEEALEERLKTIEGKLPYLFRNAGFWGLVIGDYGLDWVEKHVNELLPLLKLANERRAKELYDTPMTVYAKYSYSLSLIRRLKKQQRNQTEADQWKIERITVKNEIVRTGRRWHNIEVKMNTTLRKMSGDFRWRFSTDGEPRVTDVRHAFRRTIVYLLSQKAYKCVEFCGKKFSREWMHAGMDTFLHSELPSAVPQIIKGRIKKIRFFEEHRQYEAGWWNDTVYRLYKMAGQTLLDYLDRALVAGVKRHEGDLFQEEAATVIHDAVYTFSSNRNVTELLTPAGLKRLLSLSTEGIDATLSAIDCYLEFCNGMSAKEKRKLVKEIVFMDEPAKEANARYAAAAEEKEQKVLLKLKLTAKQRSMFNERLQRYAPTATIASMIGMFGMDNTRKMVKGMYEGLFVPATIPMPLSFLGREVQTALRGNETVSPVKNPRRLFHRLRQFGDPKKMALGQIDQPDAVIKALRHMGHELSQEVEQALTLQAVVEPKCSPEFLIAGNASVCCMSFGTDNAMEYAEYKGFGILNLYLADRIIANSVLWLNQLPVGKALVLDNIEVAPNYKRFIPYLEDLYRVTVEKLMRDYDCIVAVQGGAWSDMRLPVIERHPLPSFPWPKNAVDVPIKFFYSDAHDVIVVATTQTEAEMDEWKCQMEEYYQFIDKRKRAVREEAVPDGQWAQVAG